VLGEDRFVDVAIWRVPKSVSGGAHDFKYRLALVADDVCVLRFDNEAGKGDHKHVGVQQEPRAFTTLAQLLADFRQGVEEWRPT